MDFNAVMFDFDGTITKKGEFYPSKMMSDVLTRVALKMPMAFCTGRQLASFKKRGFTKLMEHIDENKKEDFLKNLFLVAENGCMGYSFDLESNDFKEFYKAKWPSEIIDRTELMKILQNDVKDFAEVLKVHEVAIVTSTSDYMNMEIEEIYKISDRIYETFLKRLPKIDPDYKKHFHVGNSGIGVIIIPADADKDRGIKEFTHYLGKNRGLKFDKNLREMLVVGDSAQEGGNDYYFLKGDIGTPYTVGYYDEKNDFPQPVFDENGQRLLHEEGTAYLLKKLLLTNFG